MPMCWCKREHIDGGGDVCVLVQEEVCNDGVGMYGGVCVGRGRVCMW